MLYSLINRLIELCIDNGLIDKMDEIYVRNRLLSSFNEENYDESEKISTNFSETLTQLTDIAVDRKIIEDYLYQRDIFSSELMNCFLDKPSVINKNFYNLYKESPSAATDYFYNLSKNSNYIKMDRIAKNIFFKTPSPYGDIDITINLSKPEKDPKQIALARNTASRTYPKCLLCVENEGYNGNASHPDRANHRTISVNMNNNMWRMQYSPYVYYNEHCIVLLEKHSPMSITENTFRSLLCFVEQFPHYFLGSNADLPIVGGSILAHEHYQGGRYTFPINRASELFNFNLKDFSDIEFSALNWPLSTIRLKSKNIESLVKCSSYILDKWRNYSDESLNILSHTGDTPHNTITPIARQSEGYFEIDLVLRNNRTTEEYPLGIFHPHDDVHHIKKENIGLIEVMGVAILPGRLKTELETVKSYILSDEASSVDAFENVPVPHRNWAQELKNSYNGKDDVNRFVELAVGKKFTKVLEDAGVYKLDDSGIKGFKNFITSL